MKKMIFLVALTIPLMTGIMFAGYQSSNQKEEAVVQTKMVALNATQRSQFELKMRINEIRITELNLKITKPAEIFDTFYIKKIANLEKEIRYLKSRLEAL